MSIAIIVLVVLLGILIYHLSFKCSCGSYYPEMFCGCAPNLKMENFLSEVFCPDKLTFDGINYQLWKYNRITHVFKTYEDYRKYWEFAHGKRKDKEHCVFLKPVIISPDEADGTIISTPYLQDARFYNIEHFQSRDEPVRDVPVDSSTTTKKPKNKNITKDDYIKLIQDMIAEYLKKNPECHQRLLNEDSQFYTIFQKSYEKYFRENFDKMLGYVPNKTEVEEMTLEEIHVYIDILKNLPNCQELVMRYFKTVTDKDGKDKLEYEGKILDFEIPKWLTNIRNRTVDYARSFFNRSGDEVPIIEKTDETRGPKNREDNIASNFAFKPEPRYPEKEADRKIASSYGWSFIPPQFWSVPQQRPPICLPSKDSTATVTAIYDKSVPVDALEWTQVNYPPDESGVDKRFLEDDYYYPGIYINKGKYDPNL